MFSMGENNIIPLHVFTINMYLIISIKNFFFLNIRGLGSSSKRHVIRNVM